MRKSLLKILSSLLGDSVYLVEYIESRLSRMYLRESILDYLDLLIYPRITRIDDMEEEV